MPRVRSLVRVARRRGKQVYVTFNTVVGEGEADEAVRLLAELDEIGPTAIIVQDIGVARICRRHISYWVKFIWIAGMQKKRSPILNNTQSYHQKMPRHIVPCPQLIFRPEISRPQKMRSPSCLNWLPMTTSPESIWGISSTKAGILTMLC